MLQNDAEDRVRRLEADKESLQLQVQVLSEQISAQSEKMAELERSLHDARQRLDDTEQKLQKVRIMLIIFRFIILNPRRKLKSVISLMSVCLYVYG